jgi:GNAT superfamily N-acetyltransferase
VELRQATLDDVAQLAQMRWDFRIEGTASAPPVDKAAFLAECCAFLLAGFTSGAWTCWLAEADGKIVSHIFVQRIDKIPKPAKPSDHFGYLSNVYTRPDYRRQGIGSALLERVKAWARAQDYEFLLTWPSDASVRFYKRAGFECKNESLECELRPYIP